MSQIWISHELDSPAKSLRVTSSSCPCLGDIPHLQGVGLRFNRHMLLDSVLALGPHSEVWV